MATSDIDAIQNDDIKALRSRLDQVADDLKEARAGLWGHDGNNGLRSRITKMEKTVDHLAGAVARIEQHLTGCVDNVGLLKEISAVEKRMSEIEQTTAEALRRIAERQLSDWIKTATMVLSLIGVVVLLIQQFGGVT